MRFEDLEVWRCNNIFLLQKSSAGELRTQFYSGMESGCIPKQTGLSWIQEAQELLKMLSGLIKAHTPFTFYLLPFTFYLLP